MININFILTIGCIKNNKLSIHDNYDLEDKETINSILDGFNSDQINYAELKYSVNEKEIVIGSFEKVKGKWVVSQKDYSKHIPFSGEF
jgi:hypothetical protein